MNEQTRKISLIVAFIALVVWELLVPAGSVTDFRVSFFSLIPPLVAISMALISKEVILSLFCGVWIGATMLMGYNPVEGLLATIDTHICLLYTSDAADE